MARKVAPWFLPPWVHKHLSKKKRRAQIRARDGDACWRCGNIMRFDGPPNCGKAATIEHVLPTSKVGTNSLDNLRLCHVGCNRHLADHAPAQKERMRISQRAE